MCTDAGFENPRTYIASGNLVFESGKAQKDVCAILEQKLADYAGKPVGVIMRSAENLKDILENNPFPEAPGNKVIALLLNTQAPENAEESAQNRTNEVIIPSGCEIYVNYPDGQGQSRLKLSEQSVGTARNMNTISKVYSLATRD